MKILDRYLLKSFAMTFASVFVILFFIFILQTLWLFITELAGKDLDFILIIKFLLFAMPRIIPLVLPLSVLLASIMTFGSFAENYEFAAMKSSGISLLRAMRSLTIFIVLLSICAFFFANNVIPYAEYKFINFRKDIAQMKPAMAIAAGQFNDVGIYNIKVDKKSGKDGNFLTGITIHKKTNSFDGTKNVIKAKNGQLVGNEKSNILQLVLNDGYYYEDVTPKKFEEKQRLPFAKSTFKKYIINLDLSKLNQTEGDNYEISNTNTMMNINELRYTLDSLNKSYRKDVISFADNTYQRTGIPSMGAVSARATPAKPLQRNLLDGFSPEEKRDILRNALATLQGSKYSIESSKVEFQNKIKNINTHWLSFYDKFVVAYACLVMFFIGAPLGAIIRKGGLGLPIVFAILIFITYNFANTFGRKIASENGLTPFVGSWLSSFILTPFALLLTYRAANDMAFVVNLDPVILPIQRLFATRTAQENSGKVSINPINAAYKRFTAYSALAWFCSVLIILLIPAAVLIEKPRAILIAIALIFITVNYFAVNRAQRSAYNIGKLTGKIQAEPVPVATILAFPFFPMLYFSNVAAINGLIPAAEYLGDIGLLRKSYERSSRVALITVAVIIVLCPVAYLISKVRVAIIALMAANLIIACVCAFRSQRNINALLLHKGLKMLEPAWVVATLAMPYYLFIYFYNRSVLRKYNFN